MIPQKKKPAALEPSSGRKTNMVSDPPNTSSVALSPQEIVARLRRYLELAKRSRLTLDGEVGCAMLDCLELAKELRDEVRSQAKELLLREPGLIPNWKASESAPARELSRDAVVVFERRRRGDPGAVHRGAVSASQVLDKETARLAEQPRVFPRDHVRVDLDVALGVPPDDRLVP